MSSLRSWAFSPHLGGVARVSLARVTELCGAAFWRKHLFYFKVMGILPFGCRAHVIRLKEYVRKGNIDAHAWVGANLGHSSSSPGTYDTWVPSTGSVHTTSDVFFTEWFFPHRPAGEQFSLAPSTRKSPPLSVMEQVCV